MVNNQAILGIECDYLLYDNEAIKLLIDLKLLAIR